MTRHGRTILPSMSVTLRADTVWWLALLGPLQAKKLFNSAPAAGPPSVAPHEQGELERRHRCRRQIFDLLQQSRDEEERLQEQIDVRVYTPPHMFPTRTRTDQVGRPAAPPYCISQHWFEGLTPFHTCADVVCCPLSPSPW